jgi:hypothetical protein
MAWLDRLWEGKVNEAIVLLREATEWVRNPKALEDLIGYLEKRRAYLPDYGNDTARGSGLRAHGWRSSTTGRCRPVANTRG